MPMPAKSAGVEVVTQIPPDLPPLAADTDRAPLTARDPLDLPHMPLLLYVEDNPANLRLVEEIVAFRGDLRMLAAPDYPHGISSEQFEAFLAMVKRDWGGPVGLGLWAP